MAHGNEFQTQIYVFSRHSMQIPSVITDLMFQPYTAASAETPASHQNLLRMYYQVSKKKNKIPGLKKKNMILGLIKGEYNTRPHKKRKQSNTPFPDRGTGRRVWRAKMCRGESNSLIEYLVNVCVQHREHPPRCAPMRSLHTSLLPTWHRNVTSGKTQAAGAKTMTKPTRWLWLNFHSHHRAQGINLIYAGGHCHAPSCISMELFHADTGKLLCAHYPTYGKTHQVFGSLELCFVFLQTQFLRSLTNWATLLSHPASGAQKRLANHFLDSPVQRTPQHICLWFRRVWLPRSSFLSTPTWLQSSGTTTPTLTMEKWRPGRWGESLQICQ